MGYNYFPVNIGHWVVYNVDSISYNDFTGEVDSFKFQMKEYVESVFADNEGNETYRLERFYRPDDTSDWVLKNVWAINLTASNAQKVEENIRIVKLVFPVESGTKWNGNIYNNLGSQTYEYQNAGSTFQIGGFTFDSTVIVSQKDELTLISEKYEQEVYATQVGMIYKKYINLVKQPSGVITKGINYSYTIHSYGN